MIRSMTGFGEASATIDGAHFYLEVRSLNSKYFKAVIRLPETFQVLEAELETQLRHRLNRGSIFLTVKYSDSSGSAAYTINQPALARYVEQLRGVEQTGAGSVRVDVSSLLMLPGVLQPPADEEQRLATARKALMGLLERACDGLVRMREREGAMLLSELMGHREEIAARLKQIVKKAPDVSIEYERRLRTRIEQMSKDAGFVMEPADLVREIAVWAERSDIAEEIARLNGHIDQFAEMLSGTGASAVPAAAAGGNGGAATARPIGRTLDFLTQEMLREANTIASKCGDADISRWIVEVKGAIDRIKEQVQNVE